MSAEREGILQTFERIGRALPREEAPALDALAHALSHELRGPLAAISMWIHVLGLEECDPETRERAVLAIEASVRAQSRVIDDLLELARVLAGTMRLTLEPTPIVQAVGSAIEATRSVAEANCVEVALKDEDGALVVRGDAGRITQALTRVLTRAIEGAPTDGRVDVVVSRAAGGARIAVQAAEGGVLPPAQADAGLSLGVARQIVELHGGAMTATEGPAGPVFAIDLPITRTAALTLLKRARVLVVDDDAATRDGIAAVLVLFGATVRVAGSSREALAILDEWLPDAIVSDVARSDDDGLAFVRELRARSKERGGAIPALAFTANVSTEASERARAAGYQRHLVKPIDGAGLALAIDEMLEGEYARAP